MLKLLRGVGVVVGVLLLGQVGTPLHAGEAEIPADTAAETDEDAGCVGSGTVLCLLEDRYEVTLQYVTSTETAAAKVARPRTSDSGLFYFFDPNNWEMLLKVLDGCDTNEHHWVFAASATDMGLNLVVRDTTTGASKTYVKAPGDPAPAITDVGAFPEGCAAD